MSFGTPAAKKKRVMKRNRTELSPTHRSKNYKSILSKRNKASNELATLPTNNSSVTIVSEEDNQEYKLRDIFLESKGTLSCSEEEDEYFWNLGF